MSKKVSLRFPHSNVSVLSFCHGAEEQCLLGWITIVSMRLLINKISCSSVSESKHSINSTSALQGSCGQVLFNVSLVLTVRLVMSFSLWRIKMYFASVHCNKTFFFGIISLTSALQCSLPSWTKLGSCYKLLTHKPGNLLTRRLQTVYWVTSVPFSLPQCLSWFYHLESPTTHAVKINYNATCGCSHTNMSYSAVSDITFWRAVRQVSRSVSIFFFYQ